MTKSITKEDITPTEIVRALFEESKKYESYRGEFWPAYSQLLSNLGFDESDWTLNRPKSDLRYAMLNQHLIQISQLTSPDSLFTEFRPILEAAMRVETECYQLMKRHLQVFFDFFNNGYDPKKAEIASLGPRLEYFQKNRPTDPEQIQEMDKVTSRFTELQRALKRMIQGGVESIQQAHLRKIREVMEVYERQHEQLALIFAPFKIALTPRRNDRTEREGKKRTK
ncbi:unnamed protein product [Caenorhabditis sp. 36 PRJEB53466]|nr:unnamed protein product [Caenorhabditis sp. 36 PRJEB53466]